MQQYQQFPNLLKPYKIGKVTVKNRFSMAPMGLMELLDSNGVWNDTGLAYFTERAKGGFGLVTIPAVHADEEVDPIVFKNPLGHEAEYIKAAKIILDRCHAYGTKVFIQVSAGLGRNGIPGCKSSDALPYYFAPELKTPVLTTEEVERKVALVVKMSKFLKDIGFDGIEIHAMHWGYLLDQFSMSYTNHRTDKYGGSLENRHRICKEIVEGIKAECGKDFPVCMRLGVRTYFKDFNKGLLNRDSAEEKGRTVEEAVQIAKLLEKWGYDILNVDVGTYDSFYYMFTPPYVEHGFFLDELKMVKDAVNIPVVVAGCRLNDPNMAEKAVRECYTDAVMFGRQALADPFYPKKIEMGRPEKIRPCINCDLGCNGEGNLGKYVCCAVNPLTAKENFWGLEKAIKPKKIAVIGGGVAGMEFAMVAKTRGHDVELYEKSNELGGLLHAAGHHSFKSEVLKLNAWFQNELKELGVPVHTGKEMTADDINALDVDTVVLTVGSKPIMPPIKGIDNKKTVDCVTAAMDKCEFGKKVVIIGGGQTGCEIAYDLAMKGHKVDVVDALDELMTSGTAYPTKLMLLDLFEHYGVGVHTAHRISEINDTGAVIVGSDGKTETLEADTVVMSIGFKPLQNIASDLFGRGKEVISITTGVGAIMNSVRDAYEIARSI